MADYRPSTRDMDDYYEGEMAGFVRDWDTATLWRMKLASSSVLANRDTYHWQTVAAAEDCALAVQDELARRSGR